MSFEIVDFLDELGRGNPVRWYHFIAPLGFVGFVIFCVGFTLWRLICLI